MRIERISKEEGLDLLQKEHVAQVCQVRVKEEVFSNPKHDELRDVRFLLVCKENETTFLISYNNGEEHFARVCGVSSTETIADVFDMFGYEGRDYLVVEGDFDISDVINLHGLQIVIC